MTSTSSQLLTDARRRARLSQRQLAALTGVSQPTIARIESGARQPGADLLDRLLAGCGYRLALEPLAGTGVDRSQMRRLLRLSPAARLRLAVEEAGHLDDLVQRARPAAR